MPREANMTFTLTVEMTTTALGFDREGEPTEKAQSFVEEAREWLSEAMSNLIGDTGGKTDPEVFRRRGDVDVSCEAEAVPA